MDHTLCWTKRGFQEVSCALSRWETIFQTSSLFARTPEAFSWLMGLKSCWFHIPTGPAPLSSPSHPSRSSDRWPSACHLCEPMCSGTCSLCRRAILSLSLLWTAVGVVLVPRCLGWVGHLRFLSEGTCANVGFRSPGSLTGTQRSVCWRCSASVCSSSKLLLSSSPVVLTLPNWRHSTPGGIHLDCVFEPIAGTSHWWVDSPPLLQSI